MTYVTSVAKSLAAPVPAGGAQPPRALPSSNAYGATAPPKVYLLIDTHGAKAVAKYAVTFAQPHS